MAALAGVAIGELARSATRCRPPACSRPTALRFVHGLVAAALVEDLARTERERLHREAARLLADSGASTARSPATCSSAARTATPR